MPHNRFYRYNEFSWQTCFDHHVESFICICYFNTLRPRQNVRHFPDDIFKCIFLNKNIYEFWLKFHLSCFPTVQLTVFQHWIRKWLDAGQATNHYLNQWCLVYWRIYASLGHNDLTNDKWSWWRNQMETFSALLAICAGNSPHKGQWCRALMFSLVCSWTNGWVKNGETVDLRRHRAHYDVTTMLDFKFEANNSACIKPVMDRELGANLIL